MCVYPRKKPYFQNENVGLEGEKCPHFLPSDAKASEVLATV